MRAVLTLLFCSSPLVASDDDARAALALAAARRHAQVVPAKAVVTETTTETTTTYRQETVRGTDGRLYTVLTPITTAAPAVAASGFQSGGFWPSHQCPVCGRAQYNVSGWNRDGTHNHTCPLDGTTWRH